MSSLQSEVAIGSTPEVLKKWGPENKSKGRILGVDVKLIPRHYRTDLGQPAFSSSSSTSKHSSGHVKPHAPCSNHVEETGVRKSGSKPEYDQATVEARRQQDMCRLQEK